MPRISWVMSIGCLIAAVWLGGTGQLVAQSGPALAGKVTDGQEALEGVLVSAKRNGSTITVTVVTGKDGRYSFPAGRLEPGQYSLRIRATGYDLDGSGQVSVVADKATTADLALRKIEDIAPQLTNAEWLASMPGTDAQKGQLLNCVGCHTLSRPLNSKYSADEFLTMILPRMQGYVNQSIPAHPQLRRAERLMEERGDQRVRIYRGAAEYLASINLSTRPKWNFELRTLPRPTGAATRVIYTEYDLPRETIEPHDVIVDDSGMVWYSNFGEQNLGRLDPKTGKVTEFPIERTQAGFSDRTARPAQRSRGQSVVRQHVPGHDREVRPQDRNLQILAAGGREEHRCRADQYGQSAELRRRRQGLGTEQRLCRYSPARYRHRKNRNLGAVQGRAGAHNIYDVIPDSRNNVFFTDFRQSHIGRIDAKSGEVELFEIPTPASAPRRGSMDGQDRLWFGEYRGDRIGMFDTRTSLFREWQIAPKWSSPYDVATDRNGEAWTGSMLSDRITRLNPATGDAINYLLPRSTNIRRVFVDNFGPQVIFWAGNNHGASIVKVEPLE